jgi:hypothetical protein
MKDEDKTKEQLMDELADLRRRIFDFEASEIDFMRGVRIGEILVEARCITSSQLQRTLQRQKEEDMLKHKRLGEILVESGLITREERDGALTEQQRRAHRGA